jgi:hypothetical protein
MSPGIGIRRNHPVFDVGAVRFVRKMSCLAKSDELLFEPCRFLEDFIQRNEAEANIANVPSDGLEHRKGDTARLQKLDSLISDSRHVHGELRIEAEGFLEFWPLHVLLSAKSEKTFSLISEVAVEGGGEITREEEGSEGLKLDALRRATKAGRGRNEQRNEDRRISGQSHREIFAKRIDDEVKIAGTTLRRGLMARGSVKGVMPCAVLRSSILDVSKRNEACSKRNGLNANSHFVTIIRAFEVKAVDRRADGHVEDDGVRGDR